MVAFTYATLVSVLAALSTAVHAIQMPNPDNKHNYKVAVSNFPLTDSTRKDPYHSSEDRRVMVSLFMPIRAEKCLTECQSGYMPPVTGSVTDEQFITGDKSSSGLCGKLTYSVCCSNGTIDASQIPLVVIDPHVNTSRLLYSSLARFISANGAAVLLVDHPGDASVVQFSSSHGDSSSTVYNNGKVPLSNFERLTSWNETVKKAVSTRKEDIKFALSQIHSLELLQREFPAYTFSSGLGDKSYGIVGHGLGGSVATDLGTSDAKVAFSINLSGTPPLLSSTVRNPPLWFFGRADFRRENDIHWPQTWKQLTGHATEYDLTDSAIFDVSDLPIVVELGRNEGGMMVGGRGLSGNRPVQGAHAVTCFVENIVKQEFGLDGQGTTLSDCIRLFPGVVPYPGV